MRKSTSGFTLIELSVVLVIIGLIVSGIVLAQSLIRSSRVQTIITDVATYQTAVAQFKQKYSAVPGDFSGAQAIWGINPNCGTDGGIGTGTQTCNGNGDGHINLGTSASRPYEEFLAWQHLALGGFIPGQYTGTSIAGAAALNLYCKAGVNCPGGQVNQAQAYFLQYSTGALGSTTNFWAQGPGHYLVVGEGASTSGYPAYPLLSAPEASALDSKIDDGMPGQGIWKSFEATGGAGYLPKCVVKSGTTAAPSDGTLTSEPGAVYYTANGAAPACSFSIQMNF